MAGPIVWPSTAGAPQGRWLWNRNVDVLIIGGALYFPFALVAIPTAFLVKGFGAFMVAFFLHMGLAVNQPHYAATYHLIVKERAKQPRVFKWMIGSLFVMVPITVACIHWIDVLLSPVTRIYLTWSAWHYSAQHFGIAAMYSARNKRPMQDREKFPLQVAFVGVGIFMMMSLNLIDPSSAGAFGATGARALDAKQSFAWAYPLGLFVVVVSVIAAGISHVRIKQRTGKGLDGMAWLLLCLNFFWFVIPNLLVGKNNLWGHPEIALWFPYALPFFHCMQYLGVTCHRTRAGGDVRPILLLVLLMGIGWFVFEGYSYGVQFAGRIADDKAFALVMALANIHHFWLDGMMWKRPKKAPVPVPQPDATPLRA